MRVIFNDKDSSQQPRKYEGANRRNIRDVHSAIKGPTTWSPGPPFKFARATTPFRYGYVRYEVTFGHKWTSRFSIQVFPDRADLERCPSVGPREYREETEGWEENESNAGLSQPPE